MVKEAKRVAVNSAHDLLQLLDDVRSDKQPRIVERDGERVAAVIDIADLDRVLEAPPTRADIEAAFEAAGSWSDVDAGALKRAIHEGRRSGSRPASRPA